jgi:pyruvate-formate lyase-activating enzyme
MMPLARLSSNQPSTEIALMVTRRCNMACEHCSVESGPRVQGEPTAEELVERVRAAAQAGVRTVGLTGGEPMIRPAVVFQLLRECRRLGINSAVYTNGFWGRDPESARRQLRTLRRAGLCALVVSYDRYHAEFQAIDPVLNLARAATEIDVPMRVTITRTAADPELADIAERFRAMPAVRLRFYDVQPVGRARGLPGLMLRSEIEGFCQGCAAPAITDDGRLTACNGPAYFAAPGSPLQVGSLREETMGALLERHRTDPILETIRTLGPAGLRDEVRRIPELASFRLRPRYFGICDLCQHITSNPAVVAALRTRLDGPAQRAARHAARQVIDASRRGGLLNRRHKSGPGAGSIFLHAALEGRCPEGADRILGHADLDWSRWADYLSACGLARPLLRALDAPEIGRWAPNLFAARLRARAVQDGLVTLVQSEAIRRIERTLADLDESGVLLKGTALMRRDAEARPARVSRGTGDVDIYVDPRMAGRLRALLLSAGFEGDAGAKPEAPHHLAPIRYQGIVVEVHTRLAAPFWTLPEQEVLARARPLEGTATLRTLSPEGIMLHAAVHTAQDSFSHGLKCAWDLSWTLYASPEVDWPLLASWIEASSTSRGIWASICVLARDLRFAIPASFLDRAPADDRQRRLELVARRRLYRVAERPEDLDSLSRQGIRLLMHDSWLAFGRYLLLQAAWRRARPAGWRRTIRRATGPSPARAALAHWRQYRRAVSQSAMDCS